MKTGQPARTAGSRQIQPGNIVAGLVLLAAMVGGLGWAARRWQGDVIAYAPHLRPLLDAVTTWAAPVAAGLAVLAVLMTVLTVASGRRRRRGQRLHGIAAAAIRARPDQLTVTAKWRANRPTRGQVGYPPGAIGTDPSGDLAERLTEVYGQPYTASWQPMADAVTFHTIVAAPAGAAEPAAEETVEAAAEEPLARAQQIAAGMLGNAQATVVATDPGGQPTEIRIVYAAAVKDASPAMRERMAAHAAGKMPGGSQLWRAELDPTRDTLTLRRKPALPTYVMHPASTMTKFPAGSLVLPYATDEAGNACGWDLNAAVPHALVIGPTGGGKTVLLRGVAMEAVRKGAEVWGCDPKRIELKGLRGWPGVTRVATGIEEMVELIGDAHALMEARYARIEAGHALREDLRPLVVILDEYLILVASANRHWKATKEKGQTGTAHPVLGLVKELVVLARSARIHLCLGVQRPDATLFDDGARDSIRHRVSLARLSPQGAMMLWEDPRTGTDLDMSIRGRATAITSSGSPGHVQVWWTPDPDPHVLARNPNAHSPAETACLQALRPTDEQADSVLLELPAARRAVATVTIGGDRLGATAEDAQMTVPDDVQDAVRAADLEPGQTVLLDFDDGQRVAVVEDVNADPDHAGDVLLDFRETSGEPGMLALAGDDLVFITGT